MITPILTKQLSSDGFTWNQYSPRVATISNELTNFSQVAYFAFDSWDEAHQFWHSITEKRLCGRAQVRESERFTFHAWEVKVWSLRQDALEKLTERDRQRQLRHPPMPPICQNWSPSETYRSVT